jgi:hypothetical protein
VLRQSMTAAAGRLGEAVRTPAGRWPPGRLATLNAFVDTHGFLPVSWTTHPQNT